MQTQVTFTIDPDLKKKAQQKAKKQGLSLKAVLVNLLESYNNDEFSLQFTIKEKHSYQDLQNWETLEKESKEAIKNKKQYNSLSEITAEL